MATLVANRTRRETEGLIGLVVNTVILRTDLGGNPTCREVLQRVRATTLAAYAHQDLPFEELVRTLERERNLQRTSLCQVMVIWQNSMLRPQQFSAHTLSFQAMEQSVVGPEVALTTFDITPDTTRKATGTDRDVHLQNRPVRRHDHQPDARRFPVRAHMPQRSARANACNILLLVARAWLTRGDTRMSKASF